MERAPRYPPLHARLIRLEEGPPMYRMLGYADKNNMHWDLCELPFLGYLGSFAFPRYPVNQPLPLGPGRFGLPSNPLAYTTVYWDDRSFRDSSRALCYSPGHRLHRRGPQQMSPETELFPEMAVPGTGMCSRERDSGYHYQSGLPPPKVYSNPDTAWHNINLYSVSTRF